MELINAKPVATMSLVDHEGTVVSGPSADDIVAVVDRAAGTIVLRHVLDDTYVQATGTVADGFDVQRREGSALHHYRAVGKVDADTLKKMLTMYRRGDTTWSRRVHWS